MEKKTKEQKEQEFLTYLINKYHLIYNDDTCLYDCQKSIRFQNIDVIKGHFPVKFGKVNGDFICVNCTNLSSLKGAPEEVTDNFDCSGCTGINSLIGSPKKVGKDYICSNTGISTIRGITEEVKNFKCTLNHNLLSLVNGPKYVEDNYDVSNCKNLKSLQGAPEKINGNFMCRECSSLQSLKGAPKAVGKSFSCSYCSSLSSLEFVPQKIGGFFYYKNCDKLNLDNSIVPQNIKKDVKMKEIIKKFNLKLENDVYNSDQSVILTNEDLYECSIPIKFGKVKGDFIVKGCTELQSLLNSPTEVTGNFDCSDCTSIYQHLWYMPEKIGGSIDCSGCTQITTLESLPQIINGDLNCSNTQIADFEPIIEVKGNLNCSGCKQLRSLKTLPKIGGKLDCSKCSFKITISKWFRRSKS